MSTVNYDDFEGWAYDFIHDHNLTHGNAEVYAANGELVVVFEVSQNTTLVVTVSEEELEALEGSPNVFVQLLKDKIRDRVYDFDVDEAFEESWAPGGTFTASEILGMLNDDKLFFGNVVSRF